jgi:rubredoxin
MKCALCGFEYNEKESLKACSGCPMSKGKCGLHKCPNCGYETPEEPKLIKFIKKLGRKTLNETQ